MTRREHPEDILIRPKTDGQGRQTWVVSHWKRAIDAREEAERDTLDGAQHLARAWAAAQSRQAWMVDRDGHTTPLS